MPNQKWRVTSMLTLEVHGKLITWPEEFAETMMGYYKKHGVPFVVHRNCIHANA